MTDGTILNKLSEQIARLNAKLDVGHRYLSNLNVRMNALKAEPGYTRVGRAGVISRLDHMDARVEQIDRRLDLTGAVSVKAENNMATDRISLIFGLTVGRDADGPWAHDTDGSWAGITAQGPAALTTGRRHRQPSA